MTCDEARDRLDDYVDGALDEAAFQEMELHVATCAECRAEERALRALLAHAAALPAERTPSRDLWAGVEARLAEARPRGWRPGPRLGWVAGLAAAAGVILALSTALHGPGGGRPSSGASLVPAALRSEDPVASAEREYARAAAELMSALEQQRDRLPPEALASVARDLQSIDAALQEVRRALATDPANPGLNHLLASTHQRKVEVLQHVLKLSRT
ncbi:MAG TPA: zf-HC2 domain-containing protein [Vicinamibacteria bacterium]|jgi:anti-sigma factor RsiW